MAHAELMIKNSGVAGIHSIVVDPCIPLSCTGSGGPMGIHSAFTDEAGCGPNEA